jgi:hypothetical protein
VTIQSKVRTNNNNRSSLNAYTCSVYIHIHIQCRVVIKHPDIKHSYLLDDVITILLPPQCIDLSTLNSNALLIILIIILLQQLYRTCISLVGPLKSAL